MAYRTRDWSEQLPCRSAEVKFFSAKGVVKFGVKFWWNFPCYVFQCLGVRRKISTKFHVKNGVKNGKFRANFTLLGRLWLRMIRIAASCIATRQDVSQDGVVVLLEEATRLLHLQSARASSEGRPSSIPCDINDASQTDRTRDCALEGQKAARNTHIKDKDGTTKFIASL